MKIFSHVNPFLISFSFSLSLCCQVFRVLAVFLDSFERNITLNWLWIWGDLLFCHEHGAIGTVIKPLTGMEVWWFPPRSMKVMIKKKITQALILELPTDQKHWKTWNEWYVSEGDTKTLLSWGSKRFYLFIAAAFFSSKSKSSLVIISTIEYRGKWEIQSWVTAALEGREEKVSIGGFRNTLKIYNMWDI